MARPQSRRPGYNRKAQYGLFASYVVAVTGALIALLLIVIAMADPAGFSVLRSGAGEVTRPVSSASLYSIAARAAASCEPGHSSHWHRPPGCPRVPGSAHARLWAPPRRTPAASHGCD